MVQIAAAVEHDLIDSLFLGPLSDEASNLLGAGEIAATLDGRVLLGGGGRGHGVAFMVVNHLRVNVFETAVDRQARAFFTAPDLVPDALMNPDANDVFRISCH